MTTMNTTTVLETVLPPARFKLTPKGERMLAALEAFETGDVDALEMVPDWQDLLIEWFSGPAGS